MSTYEVDVDKTPARLPTHTRALVVKKSLIEKTPPYHDAVIEKHPIPALKSGQVLVKIGAVAFNHRDLWIRYGLYPGIVLGATFGSDGAGTVVAAADPNDPLLYKRVFLAPVRGWECSPDAPEPENTYGVLGGGLYPGTFSDYVVIERDQVVRSPDHLDDVHMAAWPVGGLTAWRVTMVHACVAKGQNILITGVGGGVAITALQLCLAKGANVFVTSGSEEKIRKAVALGATAGFNYRSKDWTNQLAQILAKRGGSGLLDAVIDSGGGDIMGQVNKILKPGGRVVVYGMTANPTVTFTMREVLKHHRLIGSTIGSHRDLVDATNFIAQHRIVPVISHVLDGLGSAEQGFELMKSGFQFGKIVIRMEDSGRVVARL